MPQKTNTKNIKTKTKRASINYLNKKVSSKKLSTDTKKKIIKRRKKLYEEFKKNEHVMSKNLVDYINSQLKNPLDRVPTTEEEIYNID